MNYFDQYIRRIYFVDGKIGLIKLSWKLFLFGIFNFPLLVFWLLWKGLWS